MIEIVEVKTKKQQKEFLDFPIKLYKGCPYYSPALYIGEKAIFKKDYFYYKTCEAVYFNCYKDGKMAGRISGILQKEANKKWKQKAVRFARFDLIDDLEVAKALLGAVENWAKEKGMEEIIGPLGFSDIEKEGLLIEGFEEPTTFSENYNYPYYQTLLAQCGYGKDVDWIAHQAFLPEDFDVDKTERVINKLMARMKLRYCQEKSVGKILDKYGQAFFDIVEESYKDLYQTVPFTPEQIKDTIDSFRLILKPDCIGLILDEKDEVVAFGVMFPMVAPILNKYGGHLYPWALPKLIHALNHPSVMEFGLIGVRDAYKNTGISWCPMIPLLKRMKSGEIKYCETNLNLEDNTAILNMLGRLKLRDHRRVRSFIKKIA